MVNARLDTLGVLLVAGWLGACSGSTVQDISSGNGGFAGSSGVAGAAGSAQGGTAGSSVGGAGGSVAQDGGSEIDSGAGGGSIVDGGSADVSVEPDSSVDDGGFSEASLFDQQMPDVVLGDGATAQTCYDCSTDKCHDEVAACDQDPKCRTLLTCLFVDQCWGGPNGVDYGCAMGCANKAGISNYSDPAVQKAMDASKCTANNCKNECGM